MFPGFRRWVSMPRDRSRSLTWRSIRLCVVRNGGVQRTSRHTPATVERFTNAVLAARLITRLDARLLVVRQLRIDRFF